MTGPLDGIRIIDLTAMISGPLATMMLADQGAEVIKVENPAGGDFTRSAAKPVEEDLMPGRFGFGHPREEGFEEVEIRFEVIWCNAELKETMLSERELVGG